MSEPSSPAFPFRWVTELILYLQVAASSQLMHHLALARDSLVKFHNLAFPDKQQPTGVHSIPPPPFHILSPPSSSHYSDSLAPSSPCQIRTQDDLHAAGHIYRRKELYVEHSPSPVSPLSQTASIPTTLRVATPSNESQESSNDCDELEDDYDDDNEEYPGHGRTSDLRSTKLDHMRVIKPQDDHN